MELHDKCSWFAARATFNLNGAFEIDVMVNE